MARQDALNRLSSLTERQREVLRLRCRRMSADDIAEELVISTQAVKNHLGNIYGKLELSEDERWESSKHHSTRHDPGPGILPTPG